MIVPIKREALGKHLVMKLNYNNQSEMTMTRVSTSLFKLPHQRKDFLGWIESAPGRRLENILL
ncbi:unnamed protein product [Larinioides sclopetarius]|uniref:Uncharacterized protein n=2 Tax=Larinioides sclopetarius TaxID=280406 RepID=A0AAV1ZI96_9ARAC